MCEYSFGYSSDENLVILHRFIKNQICLIANEVNAAELLHSRPSSKSYERVKYPSISAYKVFHIAVPIIQRLWIRYTRITAYSLQVFFPLVFC